MRQPVEDLGLDVPAPAKGVRAVQALPHPDRRTAADGVPGGVSPSGPGSLIWRHIYPYRLLILDAVCIAVSLMLAYVGRFLVIGHGAASWWYPVVTTVLSAGWLLALGWNGAYQARFLGVGSEEFKRVVRASCQLFGATAVMAFTLKIDLARGFVAIALPVGLTLLVTGRLFARRALQASRRRGELVHRVVLVGDRPSVIRLLDVMRREPAAGFAVVGVCLPAGSPPLRAEDRVPVLGTIEDAYDRALHASADTITVAASPEITPETVRRLSWSLEGSGIDLVVAPAVTDVAGPRITVRPVAGLPLLHVDAPEFTGMRRIAKSCFDRAFAGLALLVMGIPLLLVAALIRLTSPGPALFRQHRVGQSGRVFRVFKFRTMYADAEAGLDSVRHLNEATGPLFKIADDPRITPLGQLLRRTSIDELPQLLNVVLGTMSLVGPRPLAVTDETFSGHERRRLLVRPGITGLWQVSGRAAQSWEDAVRLDLYYVENWSISLDLVILARTVKAVLRGDGAR